MICKDHGILPINTKPEIITKTVFFNIYKWIACSEMVINVKGVSTAEAKSDAAEIEY